MKNIEIAIIGAGPSGLAAAIELSNKGHKDIIVFDREDEAGGTPRHCGHLGFGIFEFKRIFSGPNYAKKLVSKSKGAGVKINLKSTLIKVDKNILTFSTPNGLEKYNAKKIIFALGARETARPSLLVSGTRSPNIITTGALQRFVYMEKRVPFKKVVIIGSEDVSFSALMTCRHAGIHVEAILEEDKSINCFSILKLISKYIFNIPVKTGIKIIEIKGKDKKISGTSISKNEKEEFIECDGVIFSGNFTPESAILQTSFKEFNYKNNSLHVTQNFQTKNKDIFVVGNALRGALAAYKCYFEGKNVAKYVHDSLKEEEKLVTVPIEADDNIEWCSPSLVDLNALKKSLTSFKVKRNGTGVLKVLHNDEKLLEQTIDAYTYKSIDMPWIDGLKLKKGDKIKIEFN